MDVPSPWAIRPPIPFSRKLMTANPTICALHPTVEAPAASPESPNEIARAALLIGSVRIIPMTTETAMPIGSGCRVVVRLTRSPTAFIPLAIQGAQVTEAAQAVTRQARTHAEDLAKLEADKKRLYENEPMTKDAFANYAAVYARNIDCVITGKSMNALYERIELLQADNVKLTRKNAETLIEEAADRAEKPPLSRRLGGLFSKRYNKDGLLILKEEDFLG